MDYGVDMCCQRNGWLQTKPIVLSDWLTCWNCGGAHHMSDCQKPKNQANIDKAKTTWQNNLKQLNGGNSGDKGKGPDKSRYSRRRIWKACCSTEQPSNYQLSATCLVQNLWLGNQSFYQVLWYLGSKPSSFLPSSWSSAFEGQGSEYYTCCCCSSCCHTCPSSWRKRTDYVFHYYSFQQDGIKLLWSRPVNPRWSPEKSIPGKSLGHSHHSGMSLSHIINPVLQVFLVLLGLFAQYLGVQDIRPMLLLLVM